MLEIPDHHPEMPRFLRSNCKFEYVTIWSNFAPGDDSIEDFSLQICQNASLKPQRWKPVFSVAALLLSRVMFSPLLFVISMDSGDVRIEDLDATSTTLIMRGLNRQTTREMLQTLLRLGFLMWTWAVAELTLVICFFWQGIILLMI